jgi:hypothetical protein
VRVSLSALVHRDRARLLDQFNAAVQCPDDHGGVVRLPFLLDALAECEDKPEGSRWIVDDNARLNAAALIRRYFPEPAIHVVAAEYGAAAHRRGWLRLDRALSIEQYTRLVDTAEKWSESDRTLHDVVDVYGQPCVTFGAPDPGLPKTLGYASSDRSLPLAAFHFSQAGDAPSARLLAFRCGDDFFDTGMAFTPLGDAVADEHDRRRQSRN